eukprot:3176375-Pleurochrysis_carterae.AAC.1
MMGMGDVASGEVSVRASGFWRLCVQPRIRERACGGERECGAQGASARGLTRVTTSLLGDEVDELRGSVLEARDR